MKLYGAIDLHANNGYLGILDEQGKRRFHSKIANHVDCFTQALQPFKAELDGVVVESTFNWYWLVDHLMNEGLSVHLANPTAIQKYSGLKHVDDKTDAFWLADMLRLGILPEGYIYPADERPLRDLLRKRGHLVRLRTSLINSLQNIVTRNCGDKINANHIKVLKEDRVAPFLEEQPELAMAGRVSKECIDFMTRQILQVEKAVLAKAKEHYPYNNLVTIPGVGKVIALTILLETGPIHRFAKVGNYVSYCRKVHSKWTSNGKNKGSGNRKNGNKYLAWAFSEAAELARRLDPQCRVYYQRKKQRTNIMVAHNALAHKLARATYFILKDQVPFMPNKLFS